jgi:hypothetical protein
VYFGPLDQELGYKGTSIFLRGRIASFGLGEEGLLVVGSGHGSIDCTCKTCRNGVAF